jgi:chromosome segregation ATPase
MTDPIQVIKDRLSKLRSEREVVDTDVTSLLHEKDSIAEILPKILFQLREKRENIESKESEMQILDRAIEEIETNFSHVLFTPKFYVSGNEQR